MNKNKSLVMLLALFLTAGCAGLKAKKAQKTEAEEWIRKADSAIHSAVMSNASDRNIREARSDLGSANEFFRTKNYHAASVSAQSAHSIAQLAIEEEQERRLQEESKRKAEEEASRRKTEKKKPASKKKS